MSSEESPLRNDRPFPETHTAARTSSVPREPPLAEPPEKRPREPNEENDISFDQLIDQIQDINATPFWNCIQNDQGVTFLNINQDPNNAPQLKYSVTVKPDLTVSVYCYSTKTTKLSGDFWIPTTITSLKTLVDLLDNIRAFDKSATSSGTGKKKDAILGLILSVVTTEQERWGRKLEASRSLDEQEDEMSGAHGMAASLQPSDRHCYFKDDAVEFEKHKRKQLKGRMQQRRRDIVSNCKNITFRTSASSRRQQSSVQDPFGTPSSDTNVLHPRPSSAGDATGRMSVGDLANIVGQASLLPVELNSPYK
ncbi:hypothetical protein HPB47_016924 [Ixodes persulcatus]|uniref:Uncharacterized protein n=1 Tax=Ixodes persulcatus TaxID=34615 RepID=A0AC60R0G2_IXOPE|nr:hypothetical protein HPB47_016924 [Ixodes persulcatus]